MKKILVTGGAGYIGSHCVVELVNNGFQPIIIDDFSNASPATLQNVFELCGREIPVITGDCSDEDLLRKVFQANSFDGVIHFAAFKAVGESVEEPIKYYQNNLNGVLTVVKMMEEFGVQKLVFSSSCTVYGTPTGSVKVTEETPLGIPNSPYGWTKLMAEQIIKDVARNGKLKPVLLRYFNPIGAHESGKIGELPVGVPNNIVPYMTQTAAGIREQLTVFGSDYHTPDGTCLRDFIHVTDLVIAHIAALNLSFESAVEIINIGTGKGTSVLELIHAFEEVTGKSLNWKFGPRRAGDVEAIFAEVEKAEKILNWSAKRDVKKAVEDSWRWEQYRLKHEVV